MTFQMSESWLHKYYGSQSGQQERDTKANLIQYGKNVPREEIDEWSRWKDLAEYQQNTPDIIPTCLSWARNGVIFESELQAHRHVNKLRVPGAGDSYEQALDIAQPVDILELGVGGDSAISTSIFLAYIESVKKSGAELISVDRNPLGMTWIRYQKYHDLFWRFFQDDSLSILKRMSPIRTFDMIFVDTIHSYDHTYLELKESMICTNNILMDDATFEGNDFDPNPGGVKRAIFEFLQVYGDQWNSTEMGSSSVVLLQRKEKK